jgi:hypothetical protein
MNPYIRSNTLSFKVPIFGYLIIPHHASKTHTCIHLSRFLTIFNMFSMIRFSPHFPFLHHVTWLLTHCPNCSWLTVLYTTWLSNANHLPRTSMPNPYLTLMTQTPYLCLWARCLGLWACPRPLAIGHLLDPYLFTMYDSRTVPIPLVPKTIIHSTTQNCI